MYLINENPHRNKKKLLSLFCLNIVPVYSPIVDKTFAVVDLEYFKSCLSIVFTMHKNYPVVPGCVCKANVKTTGDDRYPVCFSDGGVVPQGGILPVVPVPPTVITT